MLNPRIYSVSQINRYIRTTIENDFILNSLWVSGEISNFKFNTTGHFYFTLKDVSSAINCVMFKGSAVMLPFMPENGMSVTVCGYVSVYEKTGQYQLYAEIMEPVGVGSLSIAFAQLKDRLSEEGLFDEAYKREIPKFPNQIAVITSPTGAAIRDILQIARRRNKNVKIIVVPVLVQGDKAADTIVSAIKLVNEWAKADVIILGRGGGSIEDLWAFNEEKVARAIFASNTPVISAVGHETDFTIADFTADMRAPTPSAAAELAVDDLSNSLELVLSLKNRLNKLVFTKISRQREHLTELFDRPVLKKPMNRLESSHIEKSRLCQRLEREMALSIDKNRMGLQSLVERLESLSPLSILKRGYSVAYKYDGSLLSSVKQIIKNDIIDIKLSDGSLRAKVEEVREGNGSKKNEL